MDPSRQASRSTISLHRKKRPRLEVGNWLSCWKTWWAALLKGGWFGFRCDLELCSAVND